MVEVLSLLMIVKMHQAELGVIMHEAAAAVEPPHIQELLEVVEVVVMTVVMERLITGLVAAVVQEVLVTVVL